MSGPLSGIRVVDLTSVAMGPYATQILGDMGADVVKIESREGDAFRHAAPHKNLGMGAAFLNLNRNKRSVVLDLKNAEDHGILLDLIETADVFVSNVRPGSLRKLELDYDTLQKSNSRLIYCGAYGFSESGPYAGRPAFDDIVQSMSGLAFLQGGNGVEEPRYVNTIVADKTAGLTVAYSIAMALYERERSGVGQAIEVPMFETLVSFALVEHLGGETFKPAIGPMGYSRVLSKHRRPYRTLDGYISLMPYTDSQWKRFFILAGCPDHADDPRFSTLAGRSKNIDSLYDLLAGLVSRQTTEEWSARMSGADIPMAPVLSPAQLLEDEHLNATSYFRTDEHPTEGKLRTVGIPTAFSRTPGAIRSLAPLLGEHTAEVISEINLRRATKSRAGSN
ncbi:crotonobetainyl-CoA:carnitine CoA-transferase CaiB-like acyl-CoA transferase [Paraburkholderia sp. BL27I4N3]|uniref:CaiB/BaiF CoA transferase family protein n=1 Tax=Paraburkholderia sp. BL27I4N3 TaxID=1938805 RepID=UPI000E2406A3|nr:CoA transferase [Paraburkholderia sp. BL27I4N3]REE07415.1 crotonobetainyl-CoA:carnitine CoA-transferase CaiB-like acyl-CoA transferase [Paraburkholderia sp. BL27I4N3]